MRERQGLSSRALAERVGCSSSYVSKLETQGMVPAANVFARLVNVLECSDAEIQFLLILLDVFWLWKTHCIPRSSKVNDTLWVPCSGL